MMRYWTERAQRNMDKWGIQTMKDVALSMTEELGELTQAILQYHHEDGSLERVKEELHDLTPLCYQMLFSIQGEENGYFRDQQRTEEDKDNG